MTDPRRTTPLVLGAGVSLAGGTPGPATGPRCSPRAEAPGQATLRWDVTRLGRPVLRQFVDLALTGLTAGRRVLGCALLSGPALTARTVVASPVAVAQRVDEHTVLVSVLDNDTARATRQLDDLCDRARLTPA